MRFEASTVVRVMMLFFWVLVPCRLVGVFQCFGETYCFLFQGNAGKWRVIYRI
jgi:hypothetical protein